MYSRRQPGTLILWLFALVVLPLLVLVLTVEELDAAGRAIVGATAVVTAFAAWCFSSLTITVDDEELRWHFGPGVIRKRVPLARIASVEPTRTSPLAGWGIHWTPRGWLYNVSGLDAVWVRLRGGGQFLLGTDEPDRLVEAIERARTR